MCAVQRNQRTATEKTPTQVQGLHSAGIIVIFPWGKSKLTRMVCIIHVTYQFCEVGNDKQVHSRWV